MSNQSGRFSLITFILTAFFVGIVMYLLFGVFEILTKPGGVTRLVFSSINCLILLTMAGTSNIICRATTFATVIQLWSVTVFYTAFQFGAVIIGMGLWHGRLYILYQLIILFVYLCVALPVLNISYRKNK